MSIYPINNRRTSSLTIDYHYIRRMVGAYLEKGYNHQTWDDEIAAEVDDIIKDGIMLYYFPPPLDSRFSISGGSPEAHQWSFMRPIYTFNTQADQREYNLPENFDFPIGDITYPDDRTSFYHPIKHTSMTNIRKLEYQTQYTTYPQLFSLRSQESQGDAPQRQILVLHPTPDGVYELKMQYQATALPISESHPYPLGGQVHGQGILASCLAVAEMRKENAQGEKYRRFMELLAAGIVRDQERAAELIGYMGNPSMGYAGRGTARRNDLLFYKNVLYGNTDYS